MKLVLNEYPVGRSQFSPDYRIHYSILFNFRDEIFYIRHILSYLSKTITLILFSPFFPFLQWCSAIFIPSWKPFCLIYLALANSRLLEKNLDLWVVVLVFQGLMNYQMLKYVCWLSGTWIWMKFRGAYLFSYLHDLQLLWVLFASWYPTSEYSELNALSNFNEFASV